MNLAESSSESAIVFNPIDTKTSLFYVPSENINSDNIKILSDKLGAKGWDVISKSSLGIHSLQELVTLIDQSPLRPKDAQLVASMASSHLCPLMWSGRDQETLVVAVRLEGQSSFTRDSEEVHSTLTELLNFTFSSQRPQSRVKLLILSKDDYDQLAKHEILMSPDARRTFRHEYTETDVGARVRDLILAKAIKTRSSDIHIEPNSSVEGSNYLIRFRIDGVLRPESQTLSHEKACAVIASIKTKAEMDIANKIHPQDGRLSFDQQDLERFPQLRGKSCRVATVPTIGGESVVIRILTTPQVESLTLDRLGFPPSILKQSRELLMTPAGIVLMTGPTGSGKTTTLYSFLQSLNDGTKKILTIEQPVEMPISGLTQTEVAPEIGRDFKTLLKSALRLDPDVILIGEIRDNDTAATALQAANTGHLVFATLHTNSAIAALARLRELGLEASQIVDTVRAVYAQRLVRTCCPSCTEQYDARDEINTLLQLPDTHKLHSSVMLAKPKQDKDSDCQDCEGTGYKGRQIVTELWRMTPAERDIINGGARAEKQIQAESIRVQKFIPLAIRGLEVALSRRTSLREVLLNVTDVETLREMKLQARNFIIQKLNLSEDLS
jgi:type II secretory ATPase GspE/PulE/Tfp pilus assembly ATPase PilB-like protein